MQSVDSVYRELRTLSAGISNATAIDRVFEMILNIFFYTVLVFICFAILGIGVLTFAVTFSSTILALSFIIGSAFSSLFEGLLMILARRPYGRFQTKLAIKSVFYTYLTEHRLFFLVSFDRYWRSNRIIKR